MDTSFEVSKWFRVASRTLWVFSLVPVSLLRLLPGSKWRRRRAVTAVLRALSRALPAAGILLYRQAQPRLAQELMRARRYQRPLTVVALRFTNEQSLDGQPSTTAEEGSNEATLGPQTHPFHVIFPLVSVVVSDALRNGDIVTYDAVNDYYVVVLVESTKPQAIQAVQRLMALVSQRTLMVLRAGFAEFPTDGLTIEDLASRAQKVCDHWPVHATFHRSTG